MWVDTREDLEGGKGNCVIILHSQKLKCLNKKNQKKKITRQVSLLEGKKWVEIRCKEKVSYSEDQIYRSMGTANGKEKQITQEAIILLMS